MRQPKWKNHPSIDLKRTRRFAKSPSSCNGAVAIVRFSGLCMDSPDVYIIPEWGRRGGADAQRDFGFSPLSFEDGSVLPSEIRLAS